MVSVLVSVSASASVSVLAWVSALESVSALRYTVSRIAAAVDRPAASAKLRLRGLSPAVVPERAGVRLDRAQARVLIASSLASLERDGPIRLPVVVAVPGVVTVFSLMRVPSGPGSREPVRGSNTPRCDHSRSRPEAARP